MEKNSNIKHFRDLIVYQQAFDKANEIYEITKSYPKAEMFSMTDQIRRSSRSVCSNIAESWRKRRYKAMFISKLADSMMEASETQTWLEFSLKYQFVDKKTFDYLDTSYEDIIKMLNSMIMNANKFCFN
jgi:four helix bundle protein